MIWVDIIFIGFVLIITYRVDRDNNKLRRENAELLIKAYKGFEDGFKFARSNNLKLDEAIEEWKEQEK